MSHSPNTIPNSGPSESQAPISRNSFSIFSASAMESPDNIAVLAFLLKTANSTAELTEHAAAVRVSDINDSLAQGQIAADKNSEQLVSQAMQMRAGSIGSMAQGVTSGISCGFQVKETNYANNMESFADKVNDFKFTASARSPVLVGDGGVDSAGTSGAPSVAPVVGRLTLSDKETADLNEVKTTLMNAKTIKGPGLSRKEWKGIIESANSKPSFFEKPAGLGAPIKPGSNVTFQRLLESCETEEELNKVKDGVNRGKVAATDYLNNKIRGLETLNSTVTSSLKGVGDMIQAQMKSDTEAEASKDQAIAQALTQTYNSSLQLTGETVASMGKVGDSMSNELKQVLDSLRNTWGLDTQPVQG